MTICINQGERAVWIDERVPELGFETVCEILEIELEYLMRLGIADREEEYEFVYYPDPGPLSEYALSLELETGIPMAFPRTPFDSYSPTYSAGLAARNLGVDYGHFAREVVRLTGIDETVANRLVEADYSYLQSIGVVADNPFA